MSHPPAADSSQASPFPTASAQARLSPQRVVVLLGGPSAEREISLKSGRAVSHALRTQGHCVTEVDPLHVDLTHFDWSQTDVVFIALHGTFGEDGKVQALLEQAGVPYTGSDAATSQLAFSKSAAKERFLQFNVPTPPYFLIHESDPADRILTRAKNLGYPLVVKPDAQGSSLGVSIISGPDELPHALSRCFSLDSFGLLEAAVIGTEWTAGFIDDESLPLIQIGTDRPFFDYEAKYHDDLTRYEFDFNVTSDVVRRLELTALNACRALQTRGLARVDLMLDKYQRPWVLEINTIPGLTDHSLVPKAAARRGLSFPQLCDLALQSARSHARPERGSTRRSESPLHNHSSLKD